MCEFAVGRGSQRSCADSFRVLEPKGTRWHQFSIFGMVGNYLLMMFYTMVAGWMLYYFWKSLTGQFTRAALSVEEISGQFDTMLLQPEVMTLWMGIAVIISFGICALGVQGGVEKISKYMMSGLLILIIILAIHSVMLPGAGKGVEFYLIPNFEAMIENGIGNVVFAAMSQAFFTLSVGIGAMAICGSYKSKDESITGDAISVVVLDTFVALMAGIIIIPACFSFGIEPGAGPSLIFITLPNIFNQMAGGRVWGTLFFLLMSFAALSTVVAVFENILSFAIDLLKWDRKKAITINIILIILLSLPCILGFSVLSGIQPLGQGTNIMDLEDFLVSNNLLPLGSIVYLMFCVKKNGWGWDNFIKEANTGTGLGFPKAIGGFMKYVLPVIIVVIYIKGYFDIFSEKEAIVKIIWMVIAICFLAYIGSIIFCKKHTNK